MRRICGFIYFLRGENLFVCLVCFVVRFYEHWNREFTRTDRKKEKTRNQNRTTNHTNHFGKNHRICRSVFIRLIRSIRVKNPAITK